jgi:hypothetical protein
MLRALVLALGAAAAAALDNGFVLPGLYWSSWNHFQGSISDALLRECADAMVASGLRDAGYRGINLDVSPTACARATRCTCALALAHARLLAPSPPPPV